MTKIELDRTDVIQFHQLNKVLPNWIFKAKGAEICGLYNRYYAVIEDGMCRDVDGWWCLHVYLMDDYIFAGNMFDSEHKYPQEYCKKVYEGDFFDFNCSEIFKEYGEM